MEGRSWSISHLVSAWGSISDSSYISCQTMDPSELPGSAGQPSLGSTSLQSNSGFWDLVKSSPLNDLKLLVAPCCC